MHEYVTLDCRLQGGSENVRVVLPTSRDLQELSRLERLSCAVLVWGHASEFIKALISHGQQVGRQRWNFTRQNKVGTHLGCPVPLRLFALTSWTPTADSMQCMHAGASESLAARALDAIVHSDSDAACGFRADLASKCSPRSVAKMRHIGLL